MAWDPSPIYGADHIPSSIRFECTKNERREIYEGGKDARAGRMLDTRSQEDKSFQNGFPSLLTFVPINVDQNEAMDTKIKII